MGTLQDQFSKVQKSKCDADEEILKLRSELNNFKINQELLSQDLQSAKYLHECSLDESRDERIRLDKEHSSEISSCKSIIKEQSHTLQEYENKVCGY